MSDGVRIIHNGSPVTSSNPLPISVKGDIGALNSIQFNLTPTGSMQEGKMMWDSTNGTVQVGMPGGNVNLQLGQEQHIRAKATENITNGQVVRISGASGSKPEMALVNNLEITATDTIAIATEDISSGQNGYFTTFGLVNYIDTNHLTEGTAVYLDSTDGLLTSTMPTHPSTCVCIGVCVVKSLTVGKLFVTINSKEWKNVFYAAKDPTGFENRTGSTVTIVGSTTRTVTVSVVSGSYDIWFYGVRHNITTTKQINFADTEGLHFIYFDTDDTLKEYISPTTIQILEMIRDKCLVRIFYWDATNKTAIITTEERHGCVMDGLTHYYLHYTRGLQIVSGFSLNDFVISDGSLDSHAQFSIAEGSVSDEDIGITSSAIASTTGVPILYRTGANGYWRQLTQAGFAVYKNPSGTTNRIMYNQYTGGAWQLTEIGESNFMLIHLFATNGADYKVYSVLGQTEYSTLLAARNGAAVELASLQTGNLPGPEVRFIATVVFQTDKDYANTVHAKIVEATADGDNYINWITTDLPRGATTGSHDSLGGLHLAQSGITYGHIDDQTQTIAGAKTFTSTPILQQAGTAKAITDMLNITNSGNASDMDGTGSGIIFNQYYYNATTPAIADAARIVVATETDWTSTASTQDAYMAFQVALDGTVAEKARLSSDGSLRIGTATDGVAQIYGYRSVGAATGANDFGFRMDYYHTVADATGAKTALRSNLYTQHTSGTLVSAKGYTAYSSATGGGTTTELDGIYQRADVASGATVTTEYGFRKDDGGGAAGPGTTYGFYCAALTKASTNIAFYGGVATAANRWNLYMAGTAPNYLVGEVRIGTTSSGVSSVFVQKITSAATGLNDYGVRCDYYHDIADSAGSKITFRANAEARHTTGTLAIFQGFVNVSSFSGNGGTTTDYYGYYQRSNVGTGAALTNDYGYYKADGSGAVAQVNQYGFYCAALTKGATLNAAFYGAVASATGRWNLYMSGTAQNYLAGNLGIGATVPISLCEIQGGLTTTGAILTLGTKETSVVANDVLGRIDFYAPLDAAGTDANLVAGSIAAIAETTFSSSVNSTSLVFQTGNSEVATTKMSLTSSGNLGINTATFGTNAVAVLAIKNGTAPTSSPADTIQLYSVDLSAGNATLGLRTETAVATEAVTSDTTLSVVINGTTYKILLKA